MPKYEVTDNHTGKVYELEGSSPPTEQELAQIFGTMRDTGEAKSAPVTAAPSEGGIGQTIKNAASSVVGRFKSGLENFSAGIESGAGKFLKGQPLTEQDIQPYLDTALGFGNTTMTVPNLSKYLKEVLGTNNIGGYIQQWMGKRNAPDVQARSSLFNKYGVTPKPADITRTKSMSKFERLLEMVPSSSDVIADVGKKQLGQYGAAVERNIGQYGAAGKTLGEAGEKTAESIAKRSKLYDKIVGEKYARAELLFPKDAGVIPLPTVEATTKKILADEQKVLGSLKDSEVVNILKDVRGMGTPDIRTSKILDPTGKPYTEIIPKEMDFATLNKNLSRLKAIIRANDTAAMTGSGVKFQSSETAGALKRLVGAMEDDLTQFSKGKAPEFRKALDEARLAARKGYEVFDSNQVVSLLKKDPEKAVNLIFQPRSETNIQRMRSAMGGKAFEELKGKWLEGVIKKTPSGDIAPSSIWKNISKFDEGTLNQIFKDKNALKEIKELADLGELLMGAERIAGNPSGTAGNVVNVGYYSVLLQGLWSGLQGNPAGIAAAGGAVLLPKGLAKLYVSPTGRKLLVDAAKAPVGSPEAAKIMKKIILVAGSKGTGTAEDIPQRVMPETQQEEIPPELTPEEMKELEALRARFTK